MPAAVSERYGLAYFSVPKAASTSMKMVLYALEHETPWTGDPDRVHPQFPTHPVKPADFEAVRDKWRFTILRDPVARLLSAYGNRVEHHRDIERAIGSSLRRRLRFRLRHPFANRHPSPDAFYENLERYQTISYSIWHHTVSVRQFIGTDLSVFDRIYRIADIPALEMELAQRTGQRITLPREQTAGRKLTLDMLSRKARARVLAYTRPDYELLGDYFAPPET